MILKVSNVPGSIREAELELDFASKRWTVKNGRTQLPGVISSDGGSFQQQPWGVIWLLDGAAYPAARTSMIIWDAPMNEYDRGHMAGGARLYEPANASLKDNIVKWSYLRNSSASAVPASADGALSPVRQAMMDVLKRWVPVDVLSSNDAAFKDLTGYNTKMLFDNFWEPENKKLPTPWPPGQMPPKNTTFTTCNLTMGNLGIKLAARLGKKPGKQLAKGLLQLDAVDQDVKGCWIPSSRGGSPKAGDFYSRPDGKQVFGHVGTIGEITPSGDWITVDGGQGGYNSKLDYIKKKNRGKLIPSQLNGWIDIDIYFK